MTISRPHVFWLILLGSTLVSWLLGSHHMLGGDSVRLGATLALALAFVKAWLVGREFMEIRNAPAPLRAVFTAWAAGAGIVLAALVYASA